MAEWNKSQQRGETVDPNNPPRAVVKPELRRTPAFAVVGMWYYLAPLAIIIIVVVMVLMFWNSRDDVNERAVPTTGIEQESPAQQDTPGGINPDPRHETTADEREYRGGDRR